MQMIASQQSQMLRAREQATHPLHRTLNRFPVRPAKQCDVLHTWVLPVQEQGVHQERDQALCLEKQLFVDVGDAQAEDRLAVVLSHRGEPCKRPAMINERHDLVHVVLLEG